ncbi:hypothetical protein HNP11_003043 [Tsukamurella ocularis]|nr:hypothetical protein [Tsukamurella ocularis]MCS3788853.1 hypothetical protein [Tsukamurella ocularis]MCS3850063.1 hypothetical protein [Tsukamurella ocularis]
MPTLPDPHWRNRADLAVQVESNSAAVDVNNSYDGKFRREQNCLYFSRDKVRLRAEVLNLDVPSSSTESSERSISGNAGLSGSSIGAGRKISTTRQTAPISGDELSIADEVAALTASSQVSDVSELGYGRVRARFTVGILSDSFGEHNSWLDSAMWWTGYTADGSAIFLTSSIKHFRSPVAQCSRRLLELGNDIQFTWNPSGIGGAAALLRSTVDWADSTSTTIDTGDCHASDASRRIGSDWPDRVVESFNSGVQRGEVVLNAGWVDCVFQAHSIGLTSSGRRVITGSPLWVLKVDDPPYGWYSIPALRRPEFRTASRYQCFAEWNGTSWTGRLGIDVGFNSEVEDVGEIIQHARSRLPDRPNIDSFYSSYWETRQYGLDVDPDQNFYSYDLGDRRAVLDMEESFKHKRVPLREALLFRFRGRRADTDDSGEILRLGY